MKASAKTPLSPPPAPSLQIPACATTLPVLPDGQAGPARAHVDNAGALTHMHPLRRHLDHRGPPYGPDALRLPNSLLMNFRGKRFRRQSLPDEHCPQSLRSCGQPRAARLRRCYLIMVMAYLSQITEKCPLKRCYLIMAMA